MRFATFLLAQPSKSAWYIVTFLFQWLQPKKLLVKTKVFSLMTVSNLLFLTDQVFVIVNQ